MRKTNLKNPKQILSALIAGVHPETGAELNADSILQNVDVVRSLIVARAAMEATEARALRRAQLPKGVGKPWSEEEEVQVIAEFKAGENLQLIAERRERTVRAIEARLERLGLITASERVTSNSFTGSAPKKA